MVEQDIEKHSLLCDAQLNLTSVSGWKSSITSQEQLSEGRQGGTASLENDKNIHLCLIVAFLYLKKNRCSDVQKMASSVQLFKHQRCFSIFISSNPPQCLICMHAGHLTFLSAARQTSTSAPQRVRDRVVSMPTAPTTSAPTPAPVSGVTWWAPAAARVCHDLSVLWRQHVVKWDLVCF